jgi:LysR family transcriptional regulator, nitrogen assimilation regulatory protein
VNLKQVRYFVRIVECGSLSKAAEELGVAQPALSQHLRLLEEELGVELVVRHSRGVAPNDLGAMLLNHFRSILNEIDRTPTLVRDLTSNPSGEVRLGVPTTAARALTTRIVPRVHECYPSISLKVVEAMSSSLGYSLQHGGLDLAVLYNPRMLPLDDTIDLAPVLTEDLFLISQSRSKITQREVIPFSMLAELPLVLPCRPNVLTKLLYEQAARRGIDMNVKFEIDSMSSIIELINADFCSVMPRVAMGRELAEGKVVATPIVDPPLSWSVYIASSTKGVRSRAMRAVLKLVIDVAHEMVDDGTWPARLI